MRLELQNIKKRNVILLICAVVLMATLGVVATLTSSTGATASPSTSLEQFTVDCNDVVDVYGKAETVLNVNTSGTYRLWTRIKSDNPSADSFYVKIDNFCYVLGNNSNVDNWTWIDYVSGSNDQKFDLEVTEGSLNIAFFAREKGIQLDKVQLVGDTARCEKEFRVGANCDDPSLEENPIISDVNILGIVEDAVLHTDTLIQAVPHPSLDVKSVQFFIDDTGVRTDSSSPYCMQGARAKNCKSYSFSELAEGQHVLKVEVSAENAETFSKEIAFKYTMVHHKGTPNDPEVPTIPEELPETENPQEEDQDQENDPSVDTPDAEPRVVTAEITGSSAQLSQNKALVTDISRPTLQLSGVVASDTIVLNGIQIENTSSIQFSETGRNTVSIRDLSGEVLEEYIVVIRHPDFDGSGRVSSFDLRRIITNWRTSNDRYDLNGDGIVNSADIRILILKWAEQ